MKTLLISLVILISTAWQQAPADKPATLSVYFANNFDGDTVSFIFNGWLVFDSRTFTTDKSTGYTGNVVYLTPATKNYVITYSGDTTKTRVKNPNLIDGIITINGQKSKTQFDVSKGKYVLINEKKEKDENDMWKYGVTITQTNKKPEFE